jgi:hypothetical protein
MDVANNNASSTYSAHDSSNLNQFFKLGQAKISHNKLAKKISTAINYFFGFCPSRFAHCMDAISYLDSASYFSTLSFCLSSTTKCKAYVEPICCCINPNCLKGPFFGPGVLLRRPCLSNLFILLF